MPANADIESTDLARQITAETEVGEVRSYFPVVNPCAVKDNTISSIPVSRR
jgi:hypothetical protein